MSVDLEDLLLPFPLTAVFAEEDEDLPFLEAQRLFSKQLSENEKA